MGRADSQRRSYRYTGSTRRYNKKSRRPWGWGLVLLVLATIAWVGYYAYGVYFRPVGRNSDTIYLLIGKQTSLTDLREQIQTKVWPHYPRVMDYLLESSTKEQGLLPGRYAVTPKMSTIELIKVLTNGTQTPVDLDLRGIRTEADLVQLIDSHLMMEGEDFLKALQDSLRLQRLGLDKESVRSLFFAKPYQLMWNVSPSGLMDTIELHHKHYWTAERQARLDSLGIKASEASALAAILEEESSKRDEYPLIARLYLNRFHKDMKLQSDPTVKFALGDFSLRRILGEHLKADSPYNTYRYVGITPGPIRLPKTESIDAVLNAPQHKYLYMCAKEDFSGYHNFAVDFGTHLKNARAYQKALDARGIK